MNNNVKNIKIYNYNNSERLFIENELKDYLKSLKKEDYFEPISYILSELVTNAYKANLKRVYFNSNGLDIYSKEQYELGMKNFINDFSNFHSNYDLLLEKQNYFVLIQIFNDNKNLIIKVQNNSKLLPYEKNNILNILNIVKNKNSFEEIYLLTNTQKELGGFGLLLIFNILENLGFGIDCFDIFEEDNNTIVKLCIPLY